MKSPIKVILIAILLLSVIWGRVFLLQKEHFQRAEEYLKSSELKFAVREYDAAMHFYAPFSPYQERAAGRLWDIGATFGDKGRHDMELVAYSSIRSSFYATRWLLTPGGEWIRKCNEKIAALNVKIALKEGQLREADAASLEQKYLNLLREDRSPSALWSVLALVGFLGWAGSAGLMIIKGFNEKGIINKRAFALCLSSFVIMFAVWAGALLKA